MEPLLRGEGLNVGDLVGWLALIVSVVAASVSVLAAVRVEQALRLGVDFHVMPSRNPVRVNRGPYRRTGRVEIRPRGPGALYEVDVAAWPADRVWLLDGAGHVLSRKQIYEMQRPRLTAEDQPFTINYKHATDEPAAASSGPVWVGVVWSQPGWWGGFVAGGYRVQVNAGEDAPNERWSRFRREWVPMPNDRAPEKHPAFGSVLQPEPPER